jgi:hypothetical protein
LLSKWSRSGWWPTAGAAPIGCAQINTRWVGTGAVKAMTREFCKRGCPAEGSDEWTTLNAAMQLFLDPFNATQAQVGGFEYRFRNNGDGTVTFSFENELSMYSFFLHLDDSPYLGYKPRDFPIIVALPWPYGGALALPSRMGEMVQEFEWREPIRCDQWK